MDLSNAWAALYARWGNDYTLDPFFHRWNSEALAANAQINYSINTAGDCWTAICAVSHIGATAALAAYGPFQLTIQVDSRDIQDGAIESYLYGSHVTALANLVMPDMVFPIPKFVRPGGTISGIIINSNTANNIIRLMFHCVKFFDFLPDAHPPRGPTRSDRARVLDR